jgi:hypothetical protein
MGDLLPHHLTDGWERLPDDLLVTLRELRVRDGSPQAPGDSLLRPDDSQPPRDDSPDQPDDSLDHLYSQDQHVPLRALRHEGGSSPRSTDGRD